MARKGMILLPPVIAVVAGAGFAVCYGAGWPVHGRELALAAAISLLAAEAALVPLLLVRGSDAGATAQAGLGGTVVQLLLTMAMVAVVRIANLGAQSAAFVWWLLVFYWAMLAAVAAVMIGEVRAAGRADAQRRS